MSRLGLILGSGAAGIAAGEGVVAIDRHAPPVPASKRSGDGYVLPHLIDHEANLRQLADAGCDRILGVSSVGGLRADIGPGHYLVPDDFIGLDLPPLTTRADAGAHQVAGFDEGWRREVVDALRAATEVVDGGVYWQVAGPRLETPAEVKLIARDAHVVGMTVASECIVACEIGLRYAALCVVDNLANGVASHALTPDEVRRGQAEHRSELETVVAAVVGVLS